MTIARAHLIDPSLTRWYHCVTRCVRRAYLLGDEEHNRKEWIESRLEELANCFAVAVGGFSVIRRRGTPCDMRLHRSESDCRQDCRYSGNQRSYVDQAATGACRSRGPDGPTGNGQSWQRCGFARGRRPGRVAVAVSD